MGLVASKLNIPIFGTTGQAIELSDKTKYKTLARVSPSVAYLARGVKELLLYFNWRRLIIIRQDAPCNILIKGLPEILSATINVYQVIVNFTDTNALYSALNHMKQMARGKVF